MRTGTIPAGSDPCADAGIFRGYFSQLSRDYSPGISGCLLAPISENFRGGFLGLFGVGIRHSTVMGEYLVFYRCGIQETAAAGPIYRAGRCTAGRSEALWKYRGFYISI